MTIRTTGVQDSLPVALDLYGWPSVSLQAAVTGGGTYTIEQTLDDPFKTPLASIVWFPHPDTNLVGATTNKQGNYAYIPAAIRLRQTAGAGSVVLTIIQAGPSPA